MLLLYTDGLQISLTSSLHQNLNVLKMSVEMVKWGPQILSSIKAMRTLEKNVPEAVDNSWGKQEANQKA